MIFNDLIQSELIFHEFFPLKISFTYAHLIKIHTTGHLHFIPFFKLGNIHKGITF
jgi:hypothetical protein